MLFEVGSQGLRGSPASRRSTGAAEDGVGDALVVTKVEAVGMAWVFRRGALQDAPSWGSRILRAMVSCASLSFRGAA